MNFNMSGWGAELLELRVRETMTTVRQEMANHAHMWTVTVDMLAEWQADLEHECALARWADDGGAL